MSSNEPSTFRISTEDSGDRPEKRRVEDSEAVENKKVRGPDEPSFSQVSLYNPAFNPFISMFNPWLNPFFQPFLLFQMMAALQAGIQGFGALGAQEVEEKPEEAVVSEDQRKVVLGSQEIEVEEPSKDQKVEPEEKENAQNFTPAQIQELQFAYNFNSSPIAEQMTLLEDKLQLSHETVKKYFEDRRKEMEEKADVLKDQKDLDLALPDVPSPELESDPEDKDQEDLVKMEAPSDQPLTQGSMILTRNLANRVIHLISEHHTTQKVFANRVIGKRQGTLSEMLNHPTPYENLQPRGRKAWERILAWVKLCEKDRKAVLEERPTECCPFKASGDPPTPPPRQIIPREPRKPPTTFTPEQIEGLQKAFADNHSLKSMRRTQLANELQLRPDTVNNWFQNEKKRVQKKNNENTLIHQLLICIQ